MLGPYYAIYVEKIANDSSVVGYSYATFWLSVGILSPIFGKFADKKDRKIFLLIGGVLSFVVSILYSIATSVYQIIIIEIFNGMATACFNPAYRAITADMTSKKSRGFEYGLLDSISYITYGLAALGATAIFSFLGAKVLFLFSGILQLASSILLSKKIPPVKTR